MQHPQVLAYPEKWAVDQTLYSTLAMHVGNYNIVFCLELCRTQNENGPCPLLALCNVLLLTERMRLVAGDTVVTSTQLLDLLGTTVIENLPQVCLSVCSSTHVLYIFYPLTPSLPLSTCNRTYLKESKRTMSRTFKTPWPPFPRYTCNSLLLYMSNVRCTSPTLQ